VDPQTGNQIDTGQAGGRAASCALVARRGVKPA
jgi:hypothetical protein